MDDPKVNAHSLFEKILNIGNQCLERLESGAAVDEVAALVHERGRLVARLGSSAARIPNDPEVPDLALRCQEQSRRILVRLELLRGELETRLDEGSQNPSEPYHRDQRSPVKTLDTYA